MEHQVIDIEDRDGEDNKTAESQPDGASSSQVERIKQASSVLGKKETYSSPTREASEIQETTESQQEESALADKKNEEIRERGERRDDDLGYSLNLIERQLEQRSQLVRTERSSSSICIFKLPDSLVGIDNEAGYPEMVSIGPYHRGKDHLLDFEDHKWVLLDRVLSRTKEDGPHLSSYLQSMRELEQSTRRCYSDDIIMDRYEFTEMMLLDGLFIIELFRHLGSKDDASAEENHPIFFSRPWLIPVLLRDLLKLENQLPFDVLESLYITSEREEVGPYELEILALQVFDLALPRSFDIHNYWDSYVYPKHLLHLVYLSLRPRNFATDPEDLYRPSITSIPSVTQVHNSGYLPKIKIKFTQKTQLRLSGIKFKAKKVERTKKLDKTQKVDSFLKIDFKKFKAKVERTEKVDSMEVGGTKKVDSILDMEVSKKVDSILDMEVRGTKIADSFPNIGRTKKVERTKKVDKTQKVDSFLNIDFKNRVLEIPTITVNDFISTFFLNCIAWEHCLEDNSLYFTDYVLFMNCLLKTPGDVAFLYLDGIIATLSQDDIHVTNLFSGLAKSVAFNAHLCYLSRQFWGLEAYGNSNWATMRRTYFSSP